MSLDQKNTEQLVSSEAPTASKHIDNNNMGMDDTKQQDLEAAYERIDREYFLLKLSTTLASSTLSTTMHIEALDDMLNTEIDTLTLKKFPILIEVLKTIEHLGEEGFQQFELDPKVKETVEFKENCKQIRLKTAQLFQKFKKLFDVSDDDEFMTVYNQKVETFQRATDHLSRSEYGFLNEDPEKHPIVRRPGSLKGGFGRRFKPFKHLSKLALTSGNQPETVL